MMCSFAKDEWDVRNLSRSILVTRLNASTIRSSDHFPATHAGPLVEATAGRLCTR